MHIKGITPPTGRLYLPVKSGFAFRRPPMYNVRQTIGSGKDGCGLAQPIYVVKGGKRLSGTVTISGAKNAAVAILPAAILNDEPSILENVPMIGDILILKQIFEQIGVKTQMMSSGGLKIDASGIHTAKVHMDAVRSMRASYYLLGALLGRFGEAEIALPGGCEIGLRPIDQHIKGMQALGAEAVIEDGMLRAQCKGGLHGAEVYLDVTSVGATINIMIAATRAKGSTIIVNAAKEPHVVDTANFLNMCGASIKGAGTDVIRIKGQEKLHACSYAIIPDQIETGTYMIAAAATGGDVILKNVIPTHLEAVSAKLMEIGVHVEEGDDGREFFLHVDAKDRPRSVNIKTLPYPGFPTDLQQPIMSLLTVAKGASFITENIFESRFKHVPELLRMGAKIQINERTAVVEGVDRLRGSTIRTTDLRAGAALIIAALMAEGTSRITDISYIERGYERVCEKLTSLGASISRSKG